MPDEDAPTPEMFDQVFDWVGKAPQTNKLFEEAFGPLPSQVEPFSLVPRRGLDRVLSELLLEPGDHLVDLCCGRGGIGLWFASVSRSRLTGVDYSSRAIAQASQRATLFMPQPQAIFIVSDAAATPLEPETADAVLCVDALQLVADKAALLREVARLLRPGGRAVITTWEAAAQESKHLPPEYSIVDAGAIAEAAGVNVLVREEPEGWLDEQRTFFELVIAADNDDAEPAIRALAEEGRTFLSIPESSIRRLLLIATV